MEFIGRLSPRKFGFIILIVYIYYLKFQCLSLKCHYGFNSHWRYSSVQCDAKYELDDERVYRYPNDTVMKYYSYASNRFCFKGYTREGNYQNTEYKSIRDCSDIEVEKVVNVLNSTGGCFRNVTVYPTHFVNGTTDIYVKPRHFNYDLACFCSDNLCNSATRDILNIATFILFTLNNLPVMLIK